MLSKIRRIFAEIFLDSMPLDDFSNYDDYWVKREKQKLGYRFIWVEQHLQPKGTLLDIGCGDGAFLDYVRSKKPDLHLIGVDGSATAINKLRAKGLEG